MAPELRSLIRRFEEEAVCLLLRSHPNSTFHHEDVHVALRDAGVTFGGVRPPDTVYARLRALERRGVLHQPGKGRWQWGKGEES